MLTARKRSYIILFFLSDLKNLIRLNLDLRYFYWKKKSLNSIFYLNNTKTIFNSHNELNEEWLNSIGSGIGEI
jgi:hypothetical protein